MSRKSLIFVLCTAALAFSAKPVFAQVTIATPFVFAEHRGATSLYGEDFSFVIGASVIVPAAGTFGTNVTAVPQPPFDLSSSYSIPHVPFPIAPNQHAARVAYAGQAGQWAIAVSNESGFLGGALTHVLDDVRNLPLVGGITTTGPVLAPTLNWDPLDSTLFPSFCTGACAPGSDRFFYQVEVREVVGTSSQTIFVTPADGMAISGPTSFALPAGLIQPGQQYLLGVRLNHWEHENAFGSTFSFVENRSVAHIDFAAPIPEPESYAMLLAGLGLMGFHARRKLRASARRACEG